MAKQQGIRQILGTVFKRANVETRSSVSPVGSVRDLMDYGVAVNNTSALKITAMYAGIRLISENIASLPIKIVRNTSRGPLVDYNHPIYHIIAVRPNAYMNANTFWQLESTWVKGWGNGYAVILRHNGGASGLHPVHPSFVNVKVVDGRKWYTVSIPDSNFAFLNGIYSDDDMLHFMELTLDGIKGVNPVTYNAAALGKSIATEKFSAEFYRKGGNIRAVMESDGNMTTEEYQNFMEHIQVAANNFDTPLLEYGIKYKQLSVDPVAAQLIQSEVLSIQDVCRIINVPPHMLAELSHATFSNIEHQTIQFVQYSLRPIIKRFEQELESKLFFSNEVGNIDIKFVLDGLLRGDTAARTAYYHNAVLDGYMSRNEVRELEGLDHKDGLDEFLRPLNYEEVGKN